MVSSKPRSVIRFTAGIMLPAGACLVIGTLWHEVIGHGFAGILAGGRVERVHILGVRIWPAVGWDGWTGQYGNCEVTGIASPRGQHWMALAGSGSTWLVSVVAVALLWWRRWGARMRFVLGWLGIWWIDLLTYTLPTWGLRRSILWGGRFSEPYEAAVGLGVPGGIFQTFVILSSMALASLLIMALRRQPSGGPRDRAR